MVLTQQARGETVEASRTLDLLSQFDLQSRGAEDDSTRSLRARLLLLQGDLESAARWADAFTSLPPDRPLLWLEEPHLTKARLLLARRGEGDVSAALHILDDVHEIARRTFNLRFQIEVLALRALAFDLQGQAGDALSALRQAVELARPGGFIRVFADLGSPMQAMLHRLTRQGSAAETVSRILAAFPGAGNERAAGNDPSESRGANGGLSEPLTGRERDVLALLRGRLSNKEIAQALCLSPMTVKRHTANLYGKLGVNRRWDAVTKAEALGILPPH
jgi:LuxR family maltose regulon positive regulatory protein